MIAKLFHNRQGQGLVEYALLIAGVALVCAVGISLFGHKTGYLIDAVAVVIPGADADDNAPVGQGKLIETTSGASGSPIQLDLNTIQSNSGTARLGKNVAGNSTNQLNGLIVDPGNAGS
jgi:pilus assembly protein Flp/PilA